VYVTAVRLVSAHMLISSLKEDKTYQYQPTIDQLHYSTFMQYISNVKLVCYKDRWH